MRSRGNSTSQSGATAVEFALVFPILFLLMYGMIVYAYIYVIQQSLHYAAQEAAEAAVAVPEGLDAALLRQRSAQQTASRVLGWLPCGQKRRVIDECDNSGTLVRVEQQPQGCEWCPPDSHGFRVTLRFRMDEPDWLFPVVNLPIVGPVPPMPRTLTAVAVVRI